MRCLGFLLILAFVFPGSDLASAQLLQREALYREAFQKCGRYFGIPYQLLMAIARQESDCRPLVINIAGRDHYPGSASEALDLIRQAKARGQSYDVGLMQINSQWLQRFGISAELLLEPRNNIFMGAYILAQEIRRSGLSWQAVGHYHSKSRKRAENYAGKIKGHLLTLSDQSPAELLR
ncbi:MAG: lytic transglycosylase domain-containing protein [Desulfovibrio sp.]|nr:lytic transglycosylase domain-containing protein [Desulfovibrio sp.]